MQFFPVQATIKCKDRHTLNGHQSGLMWFTGLSGSGKSTLANAVETRLHEMGVRSYVLDGDNIRCGLNKDLGLSPEDRIENVRRIAEVAKIMVDAGLLVLAAFIMPYRESRQFVRELMAMWPYYECYVQCSLDICERRDPKGLYKKARQGIICNMTGISAPYEEPLNPDLIVNTGCLELEQAVDVMVQFLSERGLIKVPGHCRLPAEPDNR